MKEGVQHISILSRNYISVSLVFHGHVILRSITIVDEYGREVGGEKRRRAAKVQ